MLFGFSVLKHRLPFPRKEFLNQQGYLIIIIIIYVIIVGEPIPLEKVSQPTNDQINDLHLKYVDSLTKLFNHHKAKYSPNDTLVIT